MTYTEQQHKILYRVRTIMETSKRKQPDPRDGKFILPGFQFTAVQAFFPWDTDAWRMSTKAIAKEILALLDPSYRYFFDTVFVRKFIEENFNRVSILNGCRVSYEFPDYLDYCIKAAGMQEEKELYEMFCKDIDKIGEYLQVLNNSDIVDSSKSRNRDNYTGYFYLEFKTFEDYCASNLNYKLKFKNHTEYNRYNLTYKVVYDFLNDTKIDEMEVYIGFLTKLIKRKLIEKPEWIEPFVVFFSAIVNHHNSVAFKGTVKEKIVFSTFMAMNAANIENTYFNDIPHYESRVFGKLFDEFLFTDQQPDMDYIEAAANKLISERALLNQKYHN